MAPRGDRNESLLFLAYMVCLTLFILSSIWVAVDEALFMPKAPGIMFFITLVLTITFFVTILEVMTFSRGTLFSIAAIHLVPAIALIVLLPPGHQFILYYVPAAFLAIFGWVFLLIPYNITRRKGFAYLVIMSAVTLGGWLISLDLGVDGTTTFKLVIIAFSTAPGPLLSTARH